MDSKTKKKTLVGVVDSLKMDKTAKVVVSVRIQHPVYRKVVPRKKTYFAHVENMDLSVGDTVEIQESRPYSKMKRWVVKRIISKVEK